MKRILCLLALCAGALHAQIVTLSDFSHFTPDYYSQPFPADSTSWSDLTAQSNATNFAIGDFGSGSAGGAIGNGFIHFLPAETDWSLFSSVTLRGVASAANATPSLYFYVESLLSDGGGDIPTTALTAFDLVGFDAASGVVAVTASLNLLGIDPARVTAWGFVVQEFDNPAFGFTFDHLEIAGAVASAVPEPSTYGILAGLGLAAAAIYRRRRKA